MTKRKTLCLFALHVQPIEVDGAHHPVSSDWELIEDRVRFAMKTHLLAHRRDGMVFEVELSVRTEKGTEK